MKFLFILTSMMAVVMFVSAADLKFKNRKNALAAARRAGTHEPIEDWHKVDPFPYPHFHAMKGKKYGDRVKGGIAHFVYTKTEQWPYGNNVRGCFFLNGKPYKASKPKKT